MRTLSGAVAVVTGAGSGIGRALAVALAERGADLALADVNETHLGETAELLPPGRKVTTHRVDVSKLDDMQRFRDEVEREHGRVSLLVNNAGVALYGSFPDVSLEDLEWIMGINFWGVLYGCKLFLPLLLREPEANIVNLSSIFGVISPPSQIGYCAAKFAVRGFSESLRHELWLSSKVKLTVVHPGGVNTNIAATSRKGAFADAESLERDVKAFQRSLVKPPEEAAQDIIGAVLKDKARLLIGRDAWLLDKIQRFFPSKYFYVMAPLLDPKGTLRRAAARKRVADATTNGSMKHEHAGGHVKETA